MKKLFLLLSVSVFSACTAYKPQTSPPPVVDGTTQGAGPAGEELISAPSAPARNGQAVVALLDQADSHHTGGDPDAAAAALERALRIEPRNARLWQRLARVRLDQDQAAQAEQLALKSNALAGGDYRLRAQNWRIVARARSAMGDSKGARSATNKALELEGR